MAVVKKAAPAGNTTTNKVVAKPATTATPTKVATPTKATAPVAKATPAKAAPVKAATPAKAAPAKAPVGKTSVAKKPAAAPAADNGKKSVAKKPANNTSSKGGRTGGIRLTPSKPSKTFDIKVGGQATQEAFIDRFYKKMVELGYEITKEQAKSIQKAYSETLKDVTNVASFQDTTSGIFYGRRMIKTRVTNPPKAADGLQTLMLIHPEVKVRKQLADESKIKFFGQLSEDDANIFITSEGEEINIAEAEAALMAEYAKSSSKAGKKAAAKVAKDDTADDDASDDENTEEEGLIEEEDNADEETEELEEELEDEEGEEGEELFEEEEE